eukprot:1157457-Pelagomonas_calceolata.AAC.5
MDRLLTAFPSTGSCMGCDLRKKAVAWVVFGVAISQLGTGTLYIKEEAEQPTDECWPKMIGMKAVTKSGVGDRHCRSCASAQALLLSLTQMFLQDCCRASSTDCPSTIPYSSSSSSSSDPSLTACVFARCKQASRQSSIGSKWDTLSHKSSYASISDEGCHGLADSFSKVRPCKHSCYVGEAEVAHSVMVCEAANFSFFGPSFLSSGKNCLCALAWSRVHSKNHDGSV